MIETKSEPRFTSCIQQWTYVFTFFYKAYSQRFLAQVINYFSDLVLPIFIHMNTESLLKAMALIAVSGCISISLESFPGHIFPFTTGVTCSYPETGPFSEILLIVNLTQYYILISVCCSPCAPVTFKSIIEKQWQLSKLVTLCWNL